MFMIIVFLSIVIYYIARGCIEGYTFTTHEKRLSNIFINPGGKWRTLSKGIMDYHTWRYIEQIGVMLALAFSFLGAEANIFVFALTVIAAIALGWTFYESILNYIHSGEHYQDKVFTIGKYAIPIPGWLKYLGIVLALLCGTAILAILK